MATLAQAGVLMSKREMAMTLAQGHLRVDPYLESVFLLESPDENDADGPIRLLEIVEGTLEAGAIAVGFPPRPEQGIAFPYHIIEISPREFKAISGGRLQVDDHLLTVGEQLVGR